MKKLLPILGIVVVLNTFAITFLFLQKSTKPVIVPTSAFSFEPEKPEVTTQPLLIPQIVHDVNKKNAEIRTFSSEKIIFKAWEGGSRVRSSGTLKYEQPNNFRMEIRSIVGKELDLGANDQVFWYWSKRDVHPGLYWSKYEDFTKTRLKTPFNPVFIKSTLGLDQLNIQKISRVNSGPKVTIVSFSETNGMGRPVLRQVSIDNNEKIVKQIVITDLNGKPLVVAQINHGSNGLPRLIECQWYEEDYTFTMELQDVRINQQLGSATWQLPGYQPKINMADE